MWLTRLERRGTRARPPSSSCCYPISLSVSYASHSFPPSRAQTPSTHNYQNRIKLDWIKQIFSWIFSFFFVSVFVWMSSHTHTNLLDFFSPLSFLLPPPLSAHLFLLSFFLSYTEMLYTTRKKKGRRKKKWSHIYINIYIWRDGKAYPNFFGCSVLAEELFQRRSFKSSCK